MPTSTRNNIASLTLTESVHGGCRNLWSGLEIPRCRIFTDPCHLLSPQWILSVVSVKPRNDEQAKAPKRGNCTELPPNQAVTAPNYLMVACEYYGNISVQLLVTE
jgi:hypothetical protein